MRRALRWLIFLPLFFLACGQSPTPAGQQSSDYSSGKADDLERQCAGTVYTFTLDDPLKLPTAAELNLEWNHPWVISSPQNSDRKIRFDICLHNNGNIELLQALFKSYAFSPVQTFLPQANDPLKGFEKALTGDHRGLDIQLWDSSQNEGILLRGGGADSQNSFAAIISIKRQQDGTLLPTSINVLVGVLKMGDPFGQSKCAAHEEPMSAGFSLETPQFAFELCTFLGGGETTGYRVLSLAVTDSNALLTPEEQKTITLTGDDLGAALLYNYNHHNACDSFHLRLPHAEYAATSSPMAGCGSQVGEAPKRTYDPWSPTPQATVLYKIKYHQGAWSPVKEKQCAHYLFGCN